jgi:PAS domain S-box-containing protein
MLVVSGLIIALYLYSLLIADSLFSSSFVVSDAAAIMAMATFGYAATAYLFAPRKYLTATAIVGYFLVVVMVALLVLDSGFLSSPFIALWVLTALFAAPFGVFGLAAIVVTTATSVALLWSNDQLTFDVIALSLLFSVVPLILSVIAWRTSAPKITSKGKVYHNDEDRSFSELSMQLEAVTDQAHVVISAITDGVVSIDGQGSINLLNPAAQRMLGWDVADALNLHYRSVMKLYDNHDSPILEVNNPIYQALSSNMQTTSDMYSIEVNGGGKKFLASITTTPIGEPGSGAIIVFRDVTRERAEEREKAEFISTASHEMRTPVASIEGYLGLALNPSTATVDEKAREYIGKAQDAAKHLGRLFKDLLDVSKADDGRLVNNPRVIDIVPFVHDIVIGQTPSAAGKGLNIEFLSDNPRAEETEAGIRTLSPIYYTIVDPDYLREIIGNLIENAIKYTPAGTITVDVEGDKNSLTISVKDSGIGIPPDDIPHLFQKFYRVDNAETREIGGTGLGLYLCRKLAEAIDGKIWVESERQKGSTFYLKLPRTDQETARHLIDQEKQAAQKAAEQANAQAALRQPTGPTNVSPLQPPIVVAPQPTPPQQQPVSVAPMAQPVSSEPQILPDAPMPSSPLPPQSVASNTISTAKTIAGTPVQSPPSAQYQVRPTPPLPPPSAPIAAPQPPPNQPPMN